MATYSKYFGQPWYSTSSPLIVATDSGTHSFAFTNNSLLEDLKNNEDAYIIPKYIRDAIISTWDSIVFKETSASGSSISYIGIDSGMGDDVLEKPNRDLTINKFLIGKRSFSPGTQSYTASADIMTAGLIHTDIDSYFFNTSADRLSQQRTRIGILAGTDPNLHPIAPYIQSQVVKTPGGTQALTLDIVAINGNISIMSRGKDFFGNDSNTGSTVSINGIVFPSFTTSSANPDINNHNLIYSTASGSGELVWKKIEFPETDVIGITGSQLNISGLPVNLNNVSLQFSDSRYVTAQIGDIQIGSTFDRMSIADAIRKIVYPYLPPICSLRLSDGQSQYLEVGTYPNISLNYEIVKRSESSKPTKLINMIPSTYPAITSPGQISVSGLARGVVITPLMATSSLFTVKVSDGSNSNIATASISGVYPYFYGFTSSNTLTVAALSSLGKSISSKSNQKFDVTGSGNLFFAYDADYGPLLEIWDPDNSNVIGSFTTYVKTLSSPTGLWASKQYRVYQLNSVPQIGPPSENYELKFYI